MPVLWVHLTSLNKHMPQLAHCDITTTWAAGQGALSWLVWCISSQEMRDWQVALFPAMVQSESQPKSFTEVVGMVVVVGEVTIVDRTSVEWVQALTTPVVSAAAALGLTLRVFAENCCAVVPSCTAAAAAVFVTVDVFVRVKVCVDDFVIVAVAVWVKVRADDCVVVAVAVWVKVCVAVAVWLSVAVDEMVVHVAVSVLVDELEVLVEELEVLVAVGGHPFNSCWQHHAFQSGVQAHSQMSASTWQS